MRRAMALRLLGLWPAVFLPRDTLSFYLSLLGGMPDPYGAWAWLVLGIGSGGVIWERTTSCRFGSFDRNALTGSFLLTHTPQLILALVRLHRFYARQAEISATGNE